MRRLRWGPRAILYKMTGLAARSILYYFVVQFDDILSRLLAALCFGGFHAVKSMDILYLFCSFVMRFWFDLMRQALSPASNLFRIHSTWRQCPDISDVNSKQPCLSFAEGVEQISYFWKMARLWFNVGLLHRRIFWGSTWQVTPQLQVGLETHLSIVKLFCIYGN